MVQLKLGLRLPRIERDPSKGRHIRTSKVAYARGKAGHAAMRERILVWVRACGFHGTTTGEIEKVWGIPKYKFSGRISQLLADGEIFDSGRDRVDGCRVIVAKREWVNGSEVQG